MRFGKTYEEDKNQAASSGGGATFMKYFKDGDTTFRIVEEPDAWISYWEHFNPGGFPFPCTNDRKSCPGCTSSNEKMKKPSKKIAFNVLEGEYVNVYKVPKTLADKLDSRAQRLGTITDRDYTITRISSKNADGSARVDYDLEGQDKRPVDVTKLQLHDIEEMLGEAYNNAWGDSAKVQASNDNADLQQKTASIKEALASMKAQEDDKPPFEVTVVDDQDVIYDEKDLRGMDKSGILAVCAKEGLQPPSEVQQEEVDTIVDWLLMQS